MNNAKFKKLLYEFMRYVLVGGLAFLADSGTLFLFREFIFPVKGQAELFISAALGFIVGLIINYILSVVFVFKASDNRHNGKTILDFIIFLIIGLIGLGLTELGLYTGVYVLSLHYMFVKILVAGIVLVWNYTARKIFVFERKNK